MNRTFYLLFVVVLLSLSGKNPETLTYFHSPTFPAQNTTISHEVVNFNDTIPNDTLFVIKNEDGLLHSYSRKILTGVCIDGECRLLNITLYWTVTGRYLGFQLPQGEFLSKTEHDPFTQQDYEHLHALLADPYSNLANYRIEELVPMVENDEVDGVSAATIAGVKNYIVENAVYTTYTLWHIVHGSTQKKIQAYTQKHLQPELAIQILNSSNQQDVIWALENLPPDIKVTQALQDKLFALAASNELLVSNKAIEGIPSNWLDNEKDQLKLFSHFENSSYFTQVKILNKLGEAPKLATSIQLTLAENLPELNGSMVKHVLDLFTIHQASNRESEKIIASLLNHENQFIARKAFQFLNQQPVSNKKVARQLEKYEQKQN
ncbi:hypothetical protein [uncultured Sunxiuqinia sp.]|uniref:hypothetical protein n=1 Tax=uncultured Sunxiuqinia sp. TaxID=1573825 RepID=UPI00263495CE|nr:hypothetical protein [uncultured Sunxiuqinia sp.]